MENELAEKSFTTVFFVDQGSCIVGKMKLICNLQFREAKKVIIIIGFPFLTKSWEMSLTDFRRLGIKMSKASKRIATQIALMQQCCNTGTEETKNILHIARFFHHRN